MLEPVAPNGLRKGQLPRIWSWAVFISRARLLPSKARCRFPLRVSSRLTCAPLARAEVAVAGQVIPARLRIECL
jgi:hypothetical protein